MKIRKDHSCDTLIVINSLVAEGCHQLALQLSKYWREENNLNKRPEIENLLSIYSSLSNQNLKNTIDQFSGKNFSEFKNDLAELVVEKISPISEEIKRLEKDPQFIDNILLNGSKKAEKMAKSKVEKLKKIIGF